MLKVFTDYLFVCLFVCLSVAGRVLSFGDAVYYGKKGKGSRLYCRFMAVNVFVIYRKPVDANWLYVVIRHVTPRLEEVKLSSFSL